MLALLLVVLVLGLALALLLLGVRRGQVQGRRMRALRWSAVSSGPAEPQALPTEVDDATCGWPLP